MKNLTNTLIAFLVITGFLSCSDKKPTEKEANKPEIVEVPSTPETFSFKGEHKAILKEQLFYHLRNEVVNIDKNTFVKSEDLDIDGLQFEYQVILIDKGMLNPLALVDASKPNVILTGYKKDFNNEYLGDSVTIKGTIEVKGLESTGIEGKVSNATVYISAQYSKSYLEATPYNNYKRFSDDFLLRRNLIVKLSEPRIYSRDDLHLKARIEVFTEEDLAIVSKDDLAYLRNELFARHGHVFKTDKMKDYFSQKEWYTPYFNDATELLNEIEKKNALFIKSLES